MKATGAAWRPSWVYWPVLCPRGSGPGEPCKRTDLDTIASDLNRVRLPQFICACDIFSCMKGIPEHAYWVEFGLNGLIVMHSRENGRKRDTPRKEVGQWGKCGYEGHRKATELTEVVLFSKENHCPRPPPPCPWWQQRNRAPIVLVSHMQLALVRNMSTGLQLTFPYHGSRGELALLP